MNTSHNVFAQLAQSLINGAPQAKAAAMQPKIVQTVGVGKRVYNSLSDIKAV